MALGFGLDCQTTNIFSLGSNKLYCIIYNCESSLVYMDGSQKCILYILTYILKVFYSTICENWFSILTKNTPLNSTKINERFNLFTKGEYLIWNHNGLSIDKSREIRISHNLIWFKILNFLEHSGFIFGSAWVGWILALILRHLK